MYESIGNNNLSMHVNGDGRLSIYRRPRHFLPSGHETFASPTNKP